MTLRAQTLTPDQRQRALSLTAEGRQVQAIAEALQLGVNEFQVLRRADLAHPIYKTQWETAMIEGVEALADTLVTVDSIKQPYQARIYSDNVKWLLARRAAAKYGDRLDITAGVTTVDIAKALGDATSRARAVSAAVPLQLDTIASSEANAEVLVESIEDLLE